MSEDPHTRRSFRDRSRLEEKLTAFFAVVAVLVIAAIAAAISYSHMFEWAKANGERGASLWRAILFPLSVDGSIMAASLVIYADARSKRPRSKLAYAILFLGVVWSIGANVGHSWVNPIAAKLIYAWPPITLALCGELVMQFLRRTREQIDVATRKAEKVKAVKPEPKVVKPEPVVVAPRQAVGAPVPVPRPEESSADVASLTDEMRQAGWAPEDYENAKAAMRGYLEKVDPNCIGADLERVVGNFFKITKGSGYGRKVVQEFKETLAARAAASESKG